MVSQGDDESIAQLQRELAEVRAQLAESQANERVLVQACPDIVVLARLDGTVIDANETTLRMLGVGREQFIGRCAYGFLPPAAAQERKRMAEEARRTRSPVRSVDTSGPRVIDNLLVPLFDESGEVDRLAMYSRDVTEQHESARKLREQQRRRHHAEKMEALGRLASGVAHDFNNLLTPIVTYLELAKRGACIEPSLLDTALASAERATTLIERILRYGTPGESRREEVNLSRLAADAVELTRTAFAGRVKFDLEVQQGLPPLVADAAQLHQALMSLCMNAAQAVEGRRGTVLVQVDLSDNPVSCFMITVSDDGPGIEEPILRRIFDPFFSTRAPEQGSGMGLFIAQGVARAHEGQLNVSCPPDGGARFTLRLPRVERSEVIPQASPPPPATRADSSRSLRVLAVDDEAGVLQVVELALSMAGHQVHCFDNAAATVAAFDENPHAYDAAVLDQNLGDGNGLELAEHMRRAKDDMHIVLVSGRPTEELRRTAERLRVRMLPKPFSVESLQASLTMTGEPQTP